MATHFRSSVMGEFHRLLSDAMRIGHDRQSKSGGRNRREDRCIDKMDKIPVPKPSQTIGGWCRTGPYPDSAVGKTPSEVITLASARQNKTRGYGPKIKAGSRLPHSPENSAKHRG